MQKSPILLIKATVDDDIYTEIINQRRKSISFWDRYQTFQASKSQYDSFSIAVPSRI
jgi:hypothetical protein